MKTRKLGRDGPEVSAIGLGCMGMSAFYGGADEAQSIAVIHRALDLGVTLFDTAEMYGPHTNEVLVGKALKDRRDKAFIATKIAADSRQEAEAQWAESLRRLRTDHVELLQVHNMRHWQEQLPYAHELKAQGRTRYVGITHYTDAGLEEMERILRREKLDFIQIHYSVNAPRAADTVLPLAQDRGVAVLVNRAFDDGRLFAKVAGQPLPGWAAEVGVTSWAQLFLKFAISHPAVTAVIPATGKPERQRDQLRAGTGPLLSEAQRRELVRRFAA